MRILFVDDEENVLEGLERSLFHLDWEVETAVGGEEALEFLASETVDVVVTDMRMPNIDGASLLSEVKELQPNALRIVLSGHTEEEAVMRAVAVAHQFLAKPCSVDMLQGVITRAQNMRAMMQDENLQMIVGQISELPTLPSIYVELTNVLRDPKAGVREVAQIVERDVAMSVKILQLVNSSFFMHATKICSVPQAVGRLGINMVKSLALMTATFGESEGMPKELREFVASQQAHAVEVAVTARSLCANSAVRDQAFLAGMLHDVGKLILECGLPDEMQEVSLLAATEGISVEEAEDQVLGTTHAIIGGYLVGIWGLPIDVVDAISFHHGVHALAPQNNPVYTAVHLAEALVSGFPINEDFLEADPELKDKVLECQNRLSKAS